MAKFLAFLAQTVKFLRVLNFGIEPFRLVNYTGSVSVGKSRMIRTRHPLDLNSIKIRNIPGSPQVISCSF
jgi:hypothetical protein